MLVFGLCTQHRSSCHEDYRTAYFQTIHSLCKHSLSLAQYILCEKKEENERRSLKIKFSVFALSFGVARVENQFKVTGVLNVKRQ